MITTKLRSMARNAVLALALAAGIGGVAAAPALAETDWHRGGHESFDHRDDHGRAWRAHDWREHDWRDQRHYAYARPAYRYAPPSFNLVFPFR